MRVVLRVGALVATSVFAAACSDAEPRSETAYCGQIAANLEDLNSPIIATMSDIGRVLRAWRAVSATAPIAVEPEWNTLVDAMETAITVNPNEPESLQKVSDTARASEPAAKRVVTYTQEHCGLTIGVAP